MAVGRLILLVDQPVLDDSSRLTSLGTLRTLNLDHHCLVLLQARGEVGLLGGLGSLGEGERGDLANGVGILDGGGLVRLELLKVELLDEVGYKRGVVC